MSQSTCRKCGGVRPSLDWSKVFKKITSAFKSERAKEALS